MIVVILLGVVLAFAALQRGGIRPADWYIVTLALSVLALAALARSRAPAPGRSILWPLVFLPACAAFQLLPLPAWLLRVISPERARQLALSGASSAPISVVPVATLLHFLIIAACVLLFLVVRELAWRFAGSPALWMVAAPLVIVAALEAVLGIVQFHAIGPAAVASGTYGNRNHFAGLLEMALPFPVMYAVAALRRNPSRRSSPLRPALLACAALSVAAVILLGVICSLSRMGFTAAILALFVCAAGALLTRRFAPRSRWLAALRSPLAVALALVLACGLFLYLPPDRLIARFGELAFSDGISSQDRVQLWRESLPLIAAYPLFGCGLGGYESAFSKFKLSGPMFRDDYAHNDYLQSFAELGAAGFLAVAVLLVSVLVRAIRAAARDAAPDARALAVASTASLAAILLHSGVDFNLYIPANALVLAWISGMSVQ